MQGHWTKRRMLFVGFPLVALVAGTLALKSRKEALEIPAHHQLQSAFPGDSLSVLEHSDHLTLLSLDPSAGLRGTGPFYGFSVIGQTQITDPEVKAELIATLYDGMARGDSLRACFDPHHGIHAVQGKKSVDLLICFHCRQFEVFTAGTKHLAGPISISDAPQATFDHILSDAGVPRTSR